MSPRGKPAIQDMRRLCRSRLCKAKGSYEIFFDESVFITYSLKSNNAPTVNDFLTVDKSVRKLIRLLNKPRDKFKKYQFKTNLFTAISGLITKKKAFKTHRNQNAITRDETPASSIATDLPDQQMLPLRTVGGDPILPSSTIDSPPTLDVDGNNLEPSLFDLLEGMDDCYGVEQPVDNDLIDIFL